MKLFLASEAKHPDSMQRLYDFVGGFENKSIAYIPTALNGESLYDEWKESSNSWKLVDTLGAEVTPVVLEEYRDDSVVEVLRGKHILWFAGGACGYLIYWIRRCGLDKYLPELLSEGSVYVGSSAGSMVTAPTLNVTEWYIGEVERGASVIPGLGLVDFEIYPHYEDSLLSEIKNRWVGKKLYLLKNGESIMVMNGVVSFTGEERGLEGR